MNASPPRARHLDPRAFLAASALAGDGRFMPPKPAPAWTECRVVDNPHRAQRLALAEVRKT